MKIYKTIASSKRLISNLISVVVALCVLVPTSCLGENFSEGTDFVEILKVDTPPSSAEVIEFFSIGCKYCPRFKALMESWHADQGKEIFYWRVPVILSYKGNGVSPDVDHARAYYIAQALKILPQAEPILNEAVAKDKNAFNTPEKITSFFNEMGVPPEKVKIKYDSFEVQSNIKRAIYFTDLYFLRTKHFTADVTKPNLVDHKYLLANDPISQEIEHHGAGTPMLVINGKYKTNLRMVNQDAERFIKIVNYLIKMDI